jgi:rubrerythrin
VPGSGTDAAPSSDEVRERLLSAWRGEVEAGAVYELIAQRMPEREAEILRKMAAAESGHRRRLEARMAELGIPVPDPASVKLPLWLRLQARIAPVDRLLAAREAAEEQEVGDTYRRPTGDPETDKLLRDIRKEERSHSLAVKEIRATGESGPADEPSTIAVAGVQARLDRILGWPRGRVRDRRRRVRRHGRRKGRPDRGALGRGGLGAVDGDRRLSR